MSERVKKILTSLDDFLAATFMALIIIVTTLGVLMRYFFGSPLQWIEEVTMLLFVWAIMLGAVSALKNRQLVSIDLLVAKLPAGGQWIVRMVNYVLSALVLGSLAVLGYNLAVKAYEKITPILSIPYTFIDIAVPLGAVWMLVYTGIMFWRDLAGRSNIGTKKSQETKEL